MKTAKQQAKHLYKLFDLPTGMMSEEVKKCALICAHQIVKEYNQEICERGYDNDWDMWESRKQYWLKVAEEITKL